MGKKVRWYDMDKLVTRLIFPGAQRDYTKRGGSVSGSILSSLTGTVSS